VVARSSRTRSGGVLETTWKKKSRQGLTEPEYVAEQFFVSALCA
jgi:hypothetical protein